MFGRSAKFPLLKDCQVASIALFEEVKKCSAHSVGVSREMVEGLRGGEMGQSCAQSLALKCSLSLQPDAWNHK